MHHDVLTDDLWRYIGLKLDSPADRVRFRAVSKSWSSLLREPPWLMLAESNEEELYQQKIRGYDPNHNSEGEEDDDEAVVPPRGFVRLGEQRIHLIDVPNAHKARCVGSTGNWLINVHIDKTIRLLNPFSKVEFFLPSTLAFPHGLYHMAGSPPDRRFRRRNIRDGFIWKIVPSGSPLGGGDCVAAAIHHRWWILAVARPGDAAWTTVHTTDTPLHKPLYIVDVVFYKERFHAIDVRGRLIVCHVGSPRDPKPPTMSYLTAACLFEDEDEERKVYLVECAGELLMVHKSFDEFEESEDPCLYWTSGFDVYKFDFVDMEFKELESLGEYSLFLGFNSSVSVLASDYFGLIKKDCIYFTDDFFHGFQGGEIRGGHDMGVFDLEEETITPHYEGTSTSYYSPPVWIVPT